MAWDPPHDECHQCRRYRKSSARTVCGFCDFGEFFEARVDDGRPSEDDLMKFYGELTDEDGDKHASLDNLVEDDDEGSD